jgi:hypothetical protein
VTAFEDVSAVFRHPRSETSTRRFGSLHYGLSISQTSSALARARPARWSVIVLFSFPFLCFNFFAASPRPDIWCEKSPGRFVSIQFRGEVEKKRVHTLQGELHIYFAKMPNESTQNPLA